MKIYCSYDELVPIGELNPNPDNPKLHDGRQIELLALAIEKQGFRVPICVSTLSGMIVRGHGRLLAAQKLGLKEVPVDYQDYTSREEEIADMIADNQLGLLTGFDEKQLQAIFEDMREEFENFETGFSEEEIKKLLGEVDFAPVSQDEQPRLDQLNGSIICPHCGEEIAPSDIKS
jgi:Predicted transcriptional regulators